jgi:tRNA-specific adenosine deaminase 1
MVVNQDKNTVTYSGQWKDQLIHSTDLSASEKGEAFAEQIARLTMAHYNKLPKNGKPSKQKQEWTMLASICMCEQFADVYKLTVISLGTGTKCLGYEILLSDGSRIHDGHAEVMARRGFMRFLYSELEECIQRGFDCKSSILQRCQSEASEKIVFKMRENITFHFFVSQTPCGDASIHAVEQKAISDAFNNNSKRIREEEEQLLSASKKAKLLINNYGRTGARPITSSSYAPGTETETEFGEMEQKLGIVRTKPGRGPRTISMSCSDKLSKWSVLGIQGALLSYVIPDPIFMSTIIIGNSSYFNEQSLQRALNYRMQPTIKKMTEKGVPTPPIPHFICCDINFPDGKSEDRVNACSNSILSVNPNCIEVIVAHRGHRLGIGKKDSNNPKCFSIVSKYKFLESFCKLLNSLITNRNHIEHVHNNENKNLKYIEAKQLALEYMERRETFLSCEPFNNWVKTDANKFYDFNLLPKV